MGIHGTSLMDEKKVILLHYTLWLLRTPFLSITCATLIYSSVNQRKNPLVTKSAALPDDSALRTELMGECLRSLRRQYKVAVALFYRVVY